MVAKPAGDGVPDLGGLIEKHSVKLRAFMRLRADAIVLARESVSDLLQSVYREAIEEWGQFEWRGDDAFRGWLYTAALNKIRERCRYHRAEKRQVTREGPAHTLEDPEPDLLAVYARVATPSHNAGVREELARVEQAFQQLSPDDREVIVLKHISGYSFEEIGKAMNRSPEAARHLLHRALARLTSHLRRGS